MCPSTGSGPWGGFHPSETPPVLVPRGQGCRQPQGVVSLWDPPGAWGVCCARHSLQAVGRLCWARESCPCQVIPALFHAFSMAKLKPAC